MQIRLLGTGGADGIPGLYGNSRVSRYARKHRGKDIRTRSAALVDGILKLDLGPDTWHQLAREGLDARDWTAVIFTHSDDDHFAPRELQYALFPFNDYDYVGFQIYANGVICRRIMEEYPDWPFEVSMTQSFVPFFHSGYTITPIRAKHKDDTDEDAQNLIIQKKDKTLLYATDTGIWPDQTWEFLGDYAVDCLVIESSEGFVPTPYNGHLCIEETIQVVERLRRMGVLHSETRICTTHHSHQGEGTHEELEAALNPHGIGVGYDGLVIDF
jgi:phosphoribosyl 1,2-cyclic phosphate phosphodiesterase